MTDFSGRTIRVRELHDNVLNLIDNKVEKVIVKASSNEGFINGLYATINVWDEDNNTTRSYQTPLILDSSQGIAYCYVKYGLSYSVEVQAYGDTLPMRQKFTADRSARDVEFYYDCTMSPLGTWIEATDGSLISSENWKTEGAGKTAQSVVLITADHQFRIGLQNAYAEQCSWGGYGTDVAGIANRTAWTSAITDFNAKENTDAILAVLNPNWKGQPLTDGKTSGFVDGATVVYNGSTPSKGAPAAEACRLYSSGNITAGKWDLPAFGHLYLMYLNKTAINACLTACGGATLPTGNYVWSSTEYSSNSAWLLYFASGAQYTNSKYTPYSVRAVSAF